MDKRYIVERQGKPFCLYAGLLNEAHEQGLKAIRTQLIQAPNKENGNVAICYAEVQTERGTFAGLGDASPENVRPSMVACLVRLAETRAKARALRDAVNIGTCSVEELGDVDSPNGAQPAPNPNHRPHGR